MKAKGDELKKGRVNEYDLLRVIATILVEIKNRAYTRLPLFYGSSENSVWLKTNYIWYLSQVLQVY